MKSEELRQCNGGTTEHVDPADRKILCGPPDTSPATLDRHVTIYCESIVRREGVVEDTRCVE
jgi:hypothetical protein